MRLLLLLIFTTFITSCDNKQNPSHTSDTTPLESQQWHLKNSGQKAGAYQGGTAGEDINLKDTWSRFQGSGVTIAVVDSGIEKTHEDLAQNLDLTHSATYYNGEQISTDPTPTAEYPTGQLLDEPVDAAHGTACAGIAAAADNGLGIRGVAPKATLIGLNTFADTTYGQFQSFADALYHPTRPVDVSSNSWSDLPGAITEGDAEYEALVKGCTQGRQGLGTVYVFAAGNYRNRNENSTWNRELNNPCVIAVAALNADGDYAEYSSFGPNILISGYGGEYGVMKPAIVTTDLTGEKGFDATDPNPYTQSHYDITGNEEAAYTQTMNGTSAAAPMIAGVAALMLEANPSLSYRDVRYLLATTARKNDPEHPSWQRNGAGYWINPDYGFGAVDTYEAVSQAAAFSPLDANRSLSYDSGDLNLSIADLGSLDQNITVTGMLAIEHVELYLLLEHTKSGDLNISLTSPAGTTVVMSQPSSNLPNGFFYDYAGNWGFTLGSVLFLDENTSGTWQLHIADEIPEHNGSLYRYALILHGRAL